jgi:hypothetical protein
LTSERRLERDDKNSIFQKRERERFAHRTLLHHTVMAYPRGRDIIVDAVGTVLLKEYGAFPPVFYETLPPLETIRYRDKLTTLLQRLCSIEHRDAPRFEQVFNLWDRANSSKQQEQMCEDWFKRASTLLAADADSTLPLFSLEAWEAAALP